MAEPNYFALSFWRAALNHVIFCAATGAQSAWVLGSIGSADSDTHLSVPGWGVAVGAIVGAVSGLLLAMLGQALPGTPPGSLVAEGKPAPRRARPRTSRRARKPRKATTTADLKKPVKQTPPQHSA